MQHRAYLQKEITTNPRSVQAFGVLPPAMKRITAALIILSFAVSCSNNAGPQNNEIDSVTAGSGEGGPASPEAALVETAFPNMYQILKGQDASFDPALFEESEGGYGAPPPPRFFPPEELEQFKPYLIYSADSAKAIDLVSYNFIIDKSSGAQVLEPSGPDTEVGVINLQSGMRTRIFYSGPGSIIREGKWLDSATVLLGGAEKLSSTAIRPFLLRIDLTEKTLQRFTYTDSVQAQLP